LWERVARALAGLPSSELALLQRRYVAGDSIDALAAYFGRSPNAVRCALYRARGRARAALERAGLSEAEVWSYLVPSGAQFGGRVLPPRDDD